MRRAAAALVAIALVLPASPASADDAPDATEVEQMLIRMAAEVEGELDGFLADEAPLPAEARIARLEARVEELSRQIFAVRYEAGLALLGILPGIDDLEHLENAPIAPGMAMGIDDVSDLTDVEAVLADWLRLEAALSRLAAARDGLAAEAGVEPPTRSCPVGGSHGFVNGWGDDRGWGRGHKGIDVHAEAGTPVVAVESGVIVQAGWHWAGGVQAYLVGDVSGDVYYYAHMTWWAPGVEMGVRVAAGDLIGWVGVSGNADTPHLHLGWMPGAGEVDLGALTNPYWLLREICG
jgi:murein DD-endopeptidase MepM/ murein hydrolase activator NlpD